MSSILFNDAAVANKMSDRVTSGLRAVQGLGNSKFISYAVVESSDETSQYSYLSGYIVYGLTCMEIE